VTSLATVTYLPAPICVWWDVTRRCNLACCHCFSDSGPSGLEAGEEELDTARAIDLIDQLGNMDVFRVYFLGGEPLLRDDFPDLLVHCCNRGVDPLFATNGWLMDAPMARRVQRAGVQAVNVSLDGATASTHDRIRGRSGSFQRAVSAIRHLTDAGIPNVGIIQTAMKANVEETAALIDLAEASGATTFQAVPLARCGRGATIADDMGLTHADVARLRSVFKAKRESSGAGIAVSLGGGLERDEVADGVALSGSLPDFMGCKAGRTQCNIDANGDVIPCSMVRRPVAGNVREQTFRSIWEHSPVFARMRRIRTDLESCRVCRFRTVCARECPLSPTQDTVSDGCRSRRVAALHGSGR